jgi:DNA polymerase III epsilon subunit-like protein
MIELFVDCETTGFVHKDLPLTHGKQPHLVQLAMLLREDGEEVSRVSLVIKCPIEVPEAARRVHGYTQERTLYLGVGLPHALNLFLELCNPVDRIIAHNAEFERAILEIALARQSCFIPWGGDKARWFCTMQAAEPLCKIPATPAQIRAGFKKPGEFKQPKLEEALKTLCCGIELKDAHDALADVVGCAGLYDWLVANGHAGQPAGDGGAL